MARNPLFGVFSRALRTATLANRRSIPINELSELSQCKRKHGLKRRQFFKTAGAFGSSMLLSV